MKWSAYIVLYGLALVGLFVLLYHGLAFSTETDTHKVVISNESGTPLTHITITVGHRTFKLSDIEASQSSSFTAVIDTEGAIELAAMHDGEPKTCRYGYVTHNTYDFGTGGSTTLFWVGKNGENRVSFGTPFMTMTAPQPCPAAKINS